MIITREGKALRFSGSNVRAMGRASRGVRGIRLVGEDEVAGLLKVDQSKRMLIVTENGQVSKFITMSLDLTTAEQWDRKFIPSAITPVILSVPSVSMMKMI